MRLIRLIILLIKWQRFSFCKIWNSNCVIHLIFCNHKHVYSFLCVRTPLNNWWTQTRQPPPKGSPHRRLKSKMITLLVQTMPAATHPGGIGDVRAVSAQTSRPKDRKACQPIWASHRKRTHPISRKIILHLARRRASTRSAKNTANRWDWAQSKLKVWTWKRAWMKWCSVWPRPIRVHLDANATSSAGSTVTKWSFPTLTELLPSRFFFSIFII